MTFAETFCSQCGTSLGPGNSGVSHCSDHADEADTWCHNAPFGWRCTRGADHDGPCAAVACPEDVALVEGGMDRLREASSPPTDTALLNWLEKHMTDLESRSDGKFGLPDFGLLTFRWQRRVWKNGTPVVVVPTLRVAIEAAMMNSKGASDEH